MKRISRSQIISMMDKGLKPETIISKQFISSPVVNDTSRQVTFICSTEDADKIGDIVVQGGIELDTYRTNPVVMFCHDTETFPIGKTVSVGVYDNKLTATIEFVPADVPVAGPIAEGVFQLIKKGFLSAVSVGFQPLEFERIGGTDSGILFHTCSLYEISVVPVPMNPHALVIDDTMPNDKDTLTILDEVDPNKSLKDENIRNWFNAVSYESPIRINKTMKPHGVN